MIEGAHTGIGYTYLAFGTSTSAGAPTEKMRIDRQGNVGINTTSPGYTLDVNGTARITTSITTGALYSTNITSTNIVSTNISSGTLNLSTGLTSASAQVTNANITTATIPTLLNTNAVSTNVSSGTLNLSTGLTTASAQVTNANISTATISTLLNTNLTAGIARITTNLAAIGNSNTVGAIITTGGNVGIGTNNPGERLDVRGNLRVGSSTIGNYISFHGTFGDEPDNYNHTYIGERIYSGTENSELLLFKGNDTSGLSGPDNIRLLAANLRFDTYTSVLSGSFETVAAGGTTRMLIDQNGNVGIGTISPSNTLDVSGTARITTSITTGALYSTNITSTNVVSTNVSSATLNLSTSLLALGNSNTVGSIFTTGGNVGIGTTAPSGMLHLNGAALFTSTGNLTCTGDITSFGSLSDSRLKKNIESISTEQAIEIVSQLRSVTFDWRDDIFNESKRNTSDVGFIAQEVESIVPLAVDEYTEVGSGEVYKRIKHERLIPYLLSAIQYLLKKESL
jgi:hypothetical protein